LQFEGAVMLADVRREGPFGGQRAATSRVRAFEAAWARLESEAPGWPRDTTDRAFQDSLSRWLRFHESMLVGELVPEALRYLRSNPAADERRAFDHVLVDEYQDLNRAEQDLVDLLAEAGATAVVGDVDQSIYSFRYANPEGIADFDQRHPGTHDEVLDYCRRCPRTVVEMADSLIRYNHPASPTPRLQPLPGVAAGDVSIVQWRSVDDEAEGIARSVHLLIDEQGSSPGDFLVLTPRRLVGYRIRNRLRALGVPVHSFYHEEALEAERAQEAYALLTLLSAPTDRVAFRWWLGAASSTWLVGSYARLRQECEATGRSPFDLLRDLDSGAATLAGAGPLIDRYRALTARLLHLAGLDLRQLVDDLFPDGDDDFIALREIATLSLESAAEVRDVYDAVRNHITQPEMPESGDFVRVMSLHKSKGLTAPSVIVAGCIEGLIPTLDSRLTQAEQARSLNEQRRLFYVAITRCTTALVISSSLRIDRALAMRVGATLRPGWADPAGTIASRFLAEFGMSAPAPTTGQAWLAGLQT
jgi:DNA helicase-2/ATP-dependent DNA helicase PcrA